jgi:hypothetical protein
MILNVFLNYLFASPFLGKQSATPRYQKSIVLYTYSTVLVQLVSTSATSQYSVLLWHPPDPSLVRFISLSWSSTHYHRYVVRCSPLQVSEPSRISHSAPPARCILVKQRMGARMSNATSFVIPSSHPRSSWSWTVCICVSSLQYA